MCGNFAIQITCGHRVKAGMDVPCLAPAIGSRSRSEHFIDGGYARASICRFLFFVLALCCLSGMVLHAQGFGTFDKSKIVLHRKLPPVVRFNGTSFNIKATSRDTKNADAAGTLKDLLETELLKDNSRWRVDASSPEMAVTCTVISFDFPPPQSFTRNEVVPGKNKVEQPVKYNKITASLEVSYEAKDSHTGRVLDADTVSEKYSEDFEAGTNQQAGKSLPTKVIDPFKRMAGKNTDDSSGPPSAAELRSKLTHDAVHELASRITVTNEPVEVFLAEGKLEKTNQLAKTGLWTRYLEELEQMMPLPNPKDDAYRLYNIGVAYEALAYQSEDRQVASKFLQEAAINYGKAVDAKPEEKYFLEPQKRIETAMAYYRKIDGQQQAVEAANGAPSAANPGAATTTKVSAGTPSKPGTLSKPAASTSAASTPKATPRAASVGASSPPPAPSAAGKPAAAPSPGLTNDQIIKMAKAGVDEDSIEATIHDAPVVTFDLSPDGQIQLVNGGVKPKTLAAMRLRAKLPNRRPNG
jgi:hypothetical protein